MFREHLAFPDTARQAWLSGLPMYGHTSDFLFVVDQYGSMV